MHMGVGVLSLIFAGPLPQSARLLAGVVSVSVVRTQGYA